MKTIIVSLTLLISTTLFAQINYDVFVKNEYDGFIQKMNIENKIKGFVNNYIDKLATESNDITAAQWGQIKSKIDYSPYLLGVKAVLMKNYTIKELDEIVEANDIVSPVNKTGEFIFEPKPVVKEQFYRISRTFGNLVNVQIKKQIEKLK